jgi:hypothetical protein
MAIPRTFVSSTCYDLSEVRDSLVSFVNTFGFEAVLSERGDIFYHPDLHTHDSCLKEISNCHLLVLIIGGRFGGAYVADTNKSIVNAEYIAAKELGIPVFTFVKQDVMDDHRLYQTNKSKGQEFVNKINFPSIDKNDYAPLIFEFINQVRSSSVNNGFFSFQYAKDIQYLLKKQWAGMFFDLLTNRMINKKLESSAQALLQLESASKKIEQLVEHIYRQVDKTKADQTIALIDNISEATSFFAKISQRIGSKYVLEGKSIDEILALDTDRHWYDFMKEFDNYNIIRNAEDDEGNKCDVLIHKETKLIIASLDGYRSKEEIIACEDLAKGYSAYSQLSDDQKRELLKKYSIPF